MPKGKPNKFGKKNAGTRWLPEQDDLLIHLFLNGKGLNDLAGELGRSVESLDRRAWALAKKYAKVLYIPVARQDRTGREVTKRELRVLRWIIRHSRMPDKDKIQQAALIAARPKEEIEKILGRKRDDNPGFGF